VIEQMQAGTSQAAVVAGQTLIDATTAKQDHVSWAQSCP